MQLPALRLPRPAFQRPTSSTAKLHCDLDDWWFDSRYTDGACPICGWRPEGATYAAPLWLRVARGTDWELVGMVFTVLLLVLLGIFVERAAGLTPHDIVKFLTGA